LQQIWLEQHDLSPPYSAKRRLKGILNLDKLLEVILISFYLIRLTIAPSKYTPREIFISNTLHSVFFIIQSQAFTKLSWDESAGMPVGVSEPSNMENVEEQPPTNLITYTQQNLTAVLCSTTSLKFENAMGGAYISGGEWSEARSYQDWIVCPVDGYNI
jgi:hypothetical protein